MKNFSIRFILLILLVVVSPTIQKMIIGTQQKAHLSSLISDAEQSSFEDESDESDGQFICSFFKYSIHLKLPLQFSYQASTLCCSLAVNIVEPPPQSTS